MLIQHELHEAFIKGLVTPEHGTVELICVFMLDDQISAGLSTDF